MSRNVAPRWALHVNIFEKDVGVGYPVVAHVFYGLTKAEAEGYFKSHCKTDVFLRDCVNKKRWDGVDCYATVGWENLG